jgi:DNA end-binding protein Ku
VEKRESRDSVLAFPAALPPADFEFEARRIGISRRYVLRKCIPSWLRPVEHVRVFGKPRPKASRQLEYARRIIYARIFALRSSRFVLLTQLIVLGKNKIPAVNRSSHHGIRFAIKQSVQSRTMDLSFALMEVFCESLLFEARMNPRPGWTGFLKFNLISVPIQGYNAAAPGGGKIGFHLLHAKCHQRIQYKKVCPIHGEVSNDEIVSGYEVSKGHYVEIPKDERNGVRSEDDKTIAVDAFIAPNSIDPIYFSGRTYYLLPDGKVAQKPYSVMLDAMTEQERYALARVVFSGRAQLAIVHPCDSVLAMTLLSYESELRKPSAFAKDVDTVAASPAEHELAATLIKAATVKSLDLGKYKDEYTGRLAKLVEGKAKRSQHVAKSNREEPTVINLMDALRQSLNKIKKSPAKKATFAAAGRKKTSRSSHRKTG